MYGLTVIINGEHTRADAFASIIDAATAYESVLTTGAAMLAPFIGTGYETHTFPTDAYGDALTLTRGGFIGDTFNVPNVATDLGDGPTESDTYMVAVQYVPADEIESDGWTFVPSSALPVLYGPEREDESVNA